MNPKALRIMHKAYQEKHNQSDLLSPPLTPTEHWYEPKKDRKSFIHSYSRMAPSLKNTTHRVFALNVYRRLLDKSSPKKRKPVTIQKRRVSSLPTGKDAAIAFDSLDIDSVDAQFYPPGWVPCQDKLNFIPVKVSWKGAPMSINSLPLYNRLHPVESSMASILRLSPIQYLRCKRTLILAARTLKYQDIPFTKSVAQKLCRVDVNKTSALWTAFGQLGWFDPSN